MGGEEFFVLLPDTGIEQAQVLAQRIQQDFANRPMVLLEQYRSITRCIPQSVSPESHAAG